MPSKKPSPNSGSKQSSQSTTPPSSQAPQTLDDTWIFQWAQGIASRGLEGVLENLGLQDREKSEASAPPKSPES